MEESLKSLQTEFEQAYKPPYMKWFEQDFWSLRVRRLPPLARLMYRSLLQQSWRFDLPAHLPTDDSELMIMADAPDAQAWDKHRDKILSLFALTQDGKHYYHPKTLSIYEDLTAESQAKSAAGRRGVETRRKNKESLKSVSTQYKESLSIQNQIQNQIQYSADSKPLPKSTASQSETAYDCQGAARYVCEEIGKFGDKLLFVLQQVIAGEVKAGREAKAVADEMIAAWGALPDEEKKFGPRWFFGESDWRHPEKAVGKTAVEPVKRYDDGEGKRLIEMARRRREAAGGAA